MRARAGDPPRTMAQKVLAGRASDPSRVGGPAATRDTIEVKVDQVVLARAPRRAFADALASGLRRTRAELAVAYDTACVTEANSPTDPGAGSRWRCSRTGCSSRGPASDTQVRSIWSASRARRDYASPTSPGLRRSVVWACSPSSCRPGSSGKPSRTGRFWSDLRAAFRCFSAAGFAPSCCARDIALELLRRGLGDIVHKVDTEHGAPVVLEFAGPSVRLLSVGERAVLAGIAP